MYFVLDILFKTKLYFNLTIFDSVNTCSSFQAESTEAMRPDSVGLIRYPNGFSRKPARVLDGLRL